ncbi:hypothetical protein P691DRAFT_757147 [Macrolepiota fuliginosa MF-IS2]|uniref:F-box domain-containing protein n=1 Tax=Macrolepiota fuliginosa MF-IS2 TaxID=1400762 RepID=A0A9P5XL62_9AGAR|nr:hypothetical protein P691DRAFT_757147 [Macrolepiota fuliginosa MF-IS2]
MESSEPYLPQEIAELIIEFAGIDGWALLSLCLVSSRFLALSQRQLYRRIDFIDPGYWDGRPFEDIWKATVDRGTLFLKTITQHNTSLAQHIHTFNYHNHTRRDRAFWNLANKGLRIMSNLKVFTFTSLAPVEIPRLRTLLWKCRFKLEEFRWNDGEYVDPKGDLAHFLAFQPGLKVLSITLRDPLPSDTCPRLEKFIGYRQPMENILRGRFITRLEFIATAYWWDRSCSQSYDGIAKELSQLTSLIYGGSRIQRPDIRPVIPYLKSLQALHLIGYHCEWELNHLYKLDELRVFIWTSAYPEEEPHYPLKMQIALVPGWFGTMKNLQSVYINCCKGRHTPKNYLHWTSAGGDPVTTDPPKHIFDWPM